MLKLLSYVRESLSGVSVDGASDQQAWPCGAQPVASSCLAGAGSATTMARPGFSAA